jgi:hypothetical protein
VVRSGGVGYGAGGMARFGCQWHIYKSREMRFAPVCLGSARLGWVRYGGVWVPMAHFQKGNTARQGGVWSSQVVSGEVRCGTVRLGCQWHIYKSRRSGSARSAYGTARLALVRSGQVGLVRSGTVWVPMAHFTNQEKRGSLRYGRARYGLPRYGVVRLGLGVNGTFTNQEKRGLARPGTAR